MQDAHDAEARGDFAAAARTLTAVVDDYEQDYAIALELGWALTQAGREALAERAYRVALARAPASQEARLGLAWTLARELRCGEARAIAGALDDRDAATAIPRSCEASAGEASPGATAYGAYDVYAFPGDPPKSTGFGALAGLTGTLGPGWTLGGAFRAETFSPFTGAATTAFSQTEGYAHAGHEGKRVGLQLEGAVVDDGSGLLGVSEHVGVSARWSPVGDLLLDASLSAYRDERVPRLALTWSLPIAGPLRLAPGLAVQDAGGQALGNASLTGVVSLPGASAWLGAKWGPEERPAYLPAEVVYDIPERVAWGMWAGARLRVTGPLWVFATYAFDRLHGTTTSLPTRADSHAVSAGLALHF
jgi:hypothetical protein